MSNRNQQGGQHERITTYTRVGLTFDVDDEGPIDGEVVVLLHGFPTDRSSWRRIAPLLHGAGLRTLSPDQRGYSPGARPRGRAAYKLGDLAADVVALADAVGAARFHLVGHDWGGGVAWLVAGLHPERVASVTVLSTPHPIAMNQALRNRDLDQARRSWYMAAFQIPFLPERALGRGGRLGAMLRRGGLPAEDADRYAARLAEPGALRAAIDWYRAVPLSAGVAHRCRVPATLIWGRRDPFLGPLAARLTAEACLDHFQLVELDEGHWLPERAAGACAEAIIGRVGSAR
ncbi:MAG: alpha/beta hydrolase [Actinomycetales bacterium]|nr:alpha/beta hydrolase [Actinomycetales bacterium]